MAVKQLKNYFVKPQTKLDYSRSVFKYERTHSTNLLTGRIVPVAVVNCMPGDTVPNRFGFNLDSAPLLGPTLDNVYIDIISVWCPTRLVMANHNEWLGDNDTYAWTLGNNIALPKITQLYTKKAPASGGSTITRSYTYYAEKYLAPHIGLRFFNEGKATGTFTDWIYTGEYFGSESRFHNGFQVIPARQYVYIWNELFRNQNVQAPVLFSKQSGTDLSLDLQFRDGFGQLLKANRLKDVFNMARLGPSIQTVSIGSEIGNLLPVITGLGHDTKSTSLTWIQKNGNLIPSGSTALGIYSDGAGSTDSFVGSSSLSGSTSVVPQNLWADISSLTVNNLYYSIMLQKYMNKASAGRRPVEFYKTFFGLTDSDALYDMPELLSQKRYAVNISRIVATANSNNPNTSLTDPIGTQGAFSHTAVGGTLFPSFTATEYGMLWVFAVIRTQESYSSGADRYLSDGELLDTYLPVFDHIGEDYVELNELANMWTDNNDHVFGYQEAWYHYRHSVSDAVGILAPGQFLEHWTLARDFDASGSAFTVNTNFIAQGIEEIDRMMQIHCIQSGSGIDSESIKYDSDRYQWIIQFCLQGDFARTMSKDSEALLFGRL